MSVFKILLKKEWQTFQKEGVFAGSALDLADGYIHLSSADQVDGVIERHFKGQRPLYIIGFNDSQFLENLKWEEATGGQLYPHLYNSKLQIDLVSGFREIK